MRDDWDFHTSANMYQNTSSYEDDNNSRFNRFLHHSRNIADRLLGNPVTVKHSWDTTKPRALDAFDRHSAKEYGLTEAEWLKEMPVSRTEKYTRHLPKQKANNK